MQCGVCVFVFVNTDIAKKIVNLFLNIINAFPRTVMRSSSVKWTAVWCLNCCTSFWQMKCVHRQLSEKSVKYLEGVSRGEHCPFFFCFSKQIFVFYCYALWFSSPNWLTVLGKCSRTGHCHFMTSQSTKDLYHVSLLDCLLLVKDLAMALQILVQSFFFFN